jgi:hypothetical protein
MTSVPAAGSVAAPSTVLQMTFSQMLDMGTSSVAISSNGDTLLRWHGSGRARIAQIPLAGIISGGTRVTVTWLAQPWAAESAYAANRASGAQQKDGVTMLGRVQGSFSFTVASPPKFVSSSPAGGATVSAPKSITLTFDQPINAAGSTVSVSVRTAKGTSTAATGAVQANGNAINVKFTGTTVAGAYTVHWTVKSAGGTTATGSFAFTAH